MRFSIQTKIAAMLLSASLLPFVPACTDGEIAGTIGAIAIGAGIAAGAGHHHGRRGHYECRGGYKEVCHQYVDYFGNLRTECRTVYDSCATSIWIPNGAAIDKSVDDKNAESSDLASELTAESISKAKLSETEYARIFEMSFESAETFIAALEKARDGDLQAVFDLGLTRADVELLMRSVMPTEAGIEALAKSLDQSIDSARSLIEQILKFGREKRASIEDFRGRH